MRVLFAALCVLGIHWTRPDDGKFLEEVNTKYNIVWEYLEIRRCRFCPYIHLKGHVLASPPKDPS